MIRIVIEMDETTGELLIKSEAMPIVCLGVVTSAYHELLSRKIIADFDGSIRIARRVTPYPPPNGGGR